MSRRRNAAAKCATFAAGAPMDRQQSGEQPHASVAAGRSPPARLDIHAACAEDRTVRPMAAPLVTAVRSVPCRASSLLFPIAAA